MLIAGENTTDTTGTAASVTPGKSRLERALRVEWLGQMAASLFWIASVLTYGISSGGDWLQLFAASSWLIANIAALATAESE